MSPSTVIRVISMSTAHERRARFSDYAKHAAVDWGYFDALRLPELPLIHDPAIVQVRTGRPLRPGEIGCYSSHYSLWRWFLDSDHQQLLVFEDDVVVDWAAVRVLCERDLASDGIDILKLFSTYPTRLNVVRYKLFSDHSHLIRLQGYCYGTQAYILTRRGAAALVKACVQMVMPVDWAMSRYWEYGIDSYAVFPFPVLERLGPSTIGHAAGQGAETNASESARRFVWRVRDRIRRALVDLRRPSKPFGAPRDTSAPLFDVAQPRPRDEKR